MIIRDLLPKRPKLKILLMSATLNASSFASYFGQTVPMLDIPGRTFPVKQIFLEEILDRIQFTIGKKCVLKKIGLVFWGKTRLFFILWHIFAE